MANPSDTRPKLLLVDDQPKNLLALEAILEPLDADLVSVTSGTDALKRVLHEEFAAILLDVQMPDMDGFEVATVIRSRERSRHIPIIFLTAINKDERFVVRGYTVGAVDYLTKPFDPDILRSKVNIFIELFRKSRIIQQQSELLRQAKERELAEMRRASEERYLNLAESMPQIVWVADPSGDLRYCNRRWSETTGVPGDAPDWSDILHPEDRAAFLGQWAGALKSTREWQGEFRFGSRERGTYRWHLVKVLPIRSAGGPVTSWIGTSTDIDDRRIAEQAVRLLAEASTLLGSSLEPTAALEKVALRAVPILGDACFVDVKDEHGRSKRLATAHVHGAAPTRVGLERFDDPRLSIGTANALLTGRREVVFDVVKEAQEAAAGSRGDHLRFMSELGVTSFMAVPLVVRDEVLGAFTFLAIDSRRHFTSSDVALAEDLARRAAMALDNAALYAVAERERAKLEEANRAKDVFLATLSHELRTPLNAMMGWTQILRSGMLDETKFKRAVDTIDRNARAQAQLIADLLDVSRIVTGKLKVDALVIELAPILEGAVDAARPSADAKKVLLELELDADPRAELKGDPVRLQQIIGNLISNAIKFTPPGGRVVVALERPAAHRARLRVSDSGQGISSEFLPFVFDRFRQADSTTTRTHGGLGLGLAIVKHLVELHGGTVSASSEGAGKGATFRVDLPLLDASPVEVTPRADRDAGAVVGGLQGMHVLVVEDDTDGRELIAMVLTEAGAHVTAVGTAPAALEAVLRIRPDILVSDIGLPGEDGFALIRKVRALSAEQGGQIPAVALTAYASRDDTARALAAGFHAHVAKPVDPADLAAAVVRVAALVRRAGTPAASADGVARLQ